MIVPKWSVTFVFHEKLYCVAEAFIGKTFRNVIIRTRLGTRYTVVDGYLGRWSFSRHDDAVAFVQSLAAVQQYCVANSSSMINTCNRLRDVEDAEPYFSHFPRPEGYDDYKQHLHSLQMQMERFNREIAETAGVKYVQVHHRDQNRNF